MSEEYESFRDKVFKAQEEGKKQAFKKKNPPEKSGLSDEQMRWANATIDLMGMPAFKEYIEFEATLTANSLRHAFLQRVERDKDGKPSPSTKSYGEMMSYNEGFYHGLLTMKSERERIWMAYLKSTQKKEQ